LGTNTLKIQTETTSKISDKSIDLFNKALQSNLDKLATTISKAFSTGASKLGVSTNNVDIEKLIKSLVPEISAVVIKAVKEGASAKDTGTNVQKVVQL